MKGQWNHKKILQDLRNLMGKGKKPDPYLLKVQYGYKLNSEFFPILNHIGKSRRMKEFVEQIFDRVTDPRDLTFRFGPCNCPTCRD